MKVLVRDEGLDADDRRIGEITGAVPETVDAVEGKARLPLFLKGSGVNGLGRWVIRSWNGAGLAHITAVSVEEVLFTCPPFSLLFFSFFLTKRCINDYR